MNNFAYEFECRYFEEEFIHDKDKVKARNRRNNYKNKKIKAKKYDNYLIDEDGSDNSGKLADTRKRCSDPYCCGNPRRIKGRDNRTEKEKLSEYEFDNYESEE